MAGRNLYDTKAEALAEAKRMALSLHALTKRPTGVRVQLAQDTWEEIELYGDATS